MQKNYPSIKVSYATSPNDKAWLIEQGPQASLIRWKHSGLTQAVGNQWLGLPVLTKSEEMNSHGTDDAA
jgi:hypothetical protein